jgi:hypothetical protein
MMPRNPRVRRARLMRRGSAIGVAADVAVAIFWRMLRRGVWWRDGPRTSALFTQRGPNGVNRWSGRAAGTPFVARDSRTTALDPIFVIAPPRLRRGCGVRRVTRRGAIIAKI